MDALYQLGIRLIQSLQTFSPALDGFMEALTFLGRIEFYLVFIPFIYWAVDRRIGVRTLLILIYTDLIGSSFKLLLHQPRPYWISNDVIALSSETSYGIPSTHASDSVAVGGFLARRVNRSWFWIAMVIILFLIGLSRLYLGVHFPQDVLFGWLIGFAVLWAVVKWEKTVRDWLEGRSLSTQIMLGFVDSLGFVLIGFIIHVLIAGTSDPVEWSSFSGEARTVTRFITVSGTLFGTFTGYSLMRRYARFNAGGTWSRRIARYIVGVIVLLPLYFGLDVLFASIAVDESTLGYVLRYVRYGSVALWATFLAPWVFLKTGLAERE